MRNFFKRNIPKSIKNILKKIINKSFLKLSSVVEWEYAGTNWDDALKKFRVRGWNNENVGMAHSNRLNQFVNNIKAPNIFGYSNEAFEFNNLDINFHNNIMSFAYVISLALGDRKNISILDWGGSFGHYYLIAKELYPEVTFNYTCKEVSSICKTAKNVNQHVNFISSEDTVLKDNYDLVFASTSLHYNKNWRDVLKLLSEYSKNYIFITRLPIIEENSSFIFLQRPYRYGYNTEYIGWAINRLTLMEAFEKLNLHLVRKFLCMEQINILKAPEKIQYFGFLLRK